MNFVADDHTVGVRSQRWIPVGFSFRTFEGCNHRFGPGEPRTLVHRSVANGRDFGVPYGQQSAPWPQLEIDYPRVKFSVGEIVFPASS